MRLLSTLETGRRDVAASRSPGLRVSVETLPHADGDPLLVSVAVAGAVMPIRLYLYLDGELLDATQQEGGSYEYRTTSIDGGRHALTARAVDATGRWGGASGMVDWPMS
jgi:hypothetical protein